MTPSSQQSAAVEAVPDGLRLSDWIAGSGISRSTAYELLKLAAIEPEPRRVEGSRKPVSFLTAKQLPIMEGMARQLRDGRSLADLTAMVPSRTIRDHPTVPPGWSETVPDHVADSLGSSRTLNLLERLQAIDVAIATGAPLSTADVEQLLGARPGGHEVARGRVLAVREARNCWRLESIDG